MRNENQSKSLEIYKALANSYRLRIIFLCQNDGLTVTQLSKELKLNYSITSEYIGQLHKAGLITKRKNNKNVIIKSLIKIKEGGVIERV